MQLNPVITTLGRRLRLALIGGGPGSFIGAMHRQAARRDHRYEILTAVLSSDPEKSKIVEKQLLQIEEKLSIIEKRLSNE